jgi:putative endonuclease
LDLVMRAGDTIVFVEVKTLQSERWADAEAAVNPGKQRRMSRAARWYLRAMCWEDEPCRFDVVAVNLPPKGRPQIRHYVNAFVP